MIEVGLVLGLGGYFALLLWCRKQGNMVIPPMVRLGIRVRRYMITFTLAFEPFLASMARAADAAQRAQDAMSHHFEGCAVDMVLPEDPEGKKRG